MYIIYNIIIVLYYIYVNRSIGILKLIRKEIVDGSTNLTRQILYVVKV